MNRTTRVKRILVLLLVGTMVLLASCKTQPVVEEPVPPKEEPKPVVTKPGLPEKEYAEAKSLKARVDQNGLAEYAPDEYKKAEAIFKDAEAAYNKDNAKAKAALDQSIAAYNAVISKGFPLKTDEHRKGAETAKAAADGLKAAVAVKSEYAVALARYDEALAAQKAGQYEKAIGLFDEAGRMFDSVAVVAQQKKVAAEAALLAAQSSQLQAEQKAQQADAQLKSGQ